MEYKKSGILPSVLIAAVLFISGCVTLTEDQAGAGAPGQQIKDKDARISSLQEIIDDQQKQLRELSDRLNECESRP